MLVIGEKINATNKSVGEAIARRDADFVAKLARAQAEAGADYIDVNAGSDKGSGGGDTSAIEWLVGVVQAATDKPLTIDSESPDVIEAGLKKYTGEKPMINSISAEKSSSSPERGSAPRTTAGWKITRTAIRTVRNPNRIIYSPFQTGHIASTGQYSRLYGYVRNIFKE